MISHGFAVVSAAGTAVQLLASTSPARPTGFITIYPRIVSGTPNVGEVRIGGIPLTGTSIPSGSGAPLYPGDAAVVWPFGGNASVELQDLWVDADNNGDGVQFLFGAP